MEMVFGSIRFQLMQHLFYDTFKITVPSSEIFALKVVSTSIESSNLSGATTDILSINDSDSIDLTTLINNTHSL